MLDATATAAVRPDTEADSRSPHRPAARRLASDPNLDAIIRSTVAARLRLLRRRSGLTLLDVAIRARTYRPIVGRAERGKHTLSIDTATRIAEANGGGLRDVLEAIDEVLGLGGAQP
jgi:ribosome-binding protein aMBF1 (putative translation factor)